MHGKTLASINTPIENGVEVADIAEQLPEDIKNLLGRDGIIKLSLSVKRAMLSHSGPLPLAEHYKQYEEAHPGSAARILDYMDNQQSHRFVCEKTELDIAKIQAKAEVRERLIGQILAFFIAVGLIAGAVFLSINGHDGVAVVFVGAAALGIIKKFIDGSSLKNMVAKSDAAPEARPALTKKKPARKKIAEFHLTFTLLFMTNNEINVAINATTSGFDTAIARMIKGTEDWHIATVHIIQDLEIRFAQMFANKLLNETTANTLGLQSALDSLYPADSWRVKLKRCFSQQRPGGKCPKPGSYGFQSDCFYL